MPVAEAKVVPRLRELYEREIRDELRRRFGYASPMQVPRVEKIVVNMGVGEAKQDSRALEQAIDQLATIAGQRPNVRRARKSIAAFKLRDGMPVGVAVTLRGARMYEFLDRLTAIAIPRIRDFRGLSPRSFDGRGNYSLGLREQIIFPEIDYDAIDEVRGLDVTIATSAKTDAEAFALLLALGMPFAREGRPELPGDGDAPAAAVPPPGEPERAVPAEDTGPVPGEEERAERTEAEHAALEQMREEAGTDATPEGALAASGEPDGPPAGGDAGAEATGQEGELDSSGTDTD